MRRRILSLLLAGAMLLLALPVSAQPLLIVYRDKPPYSYTVKDVPKGLLIDKTAAILEAAGLPRNFQELPIKRILNAIEDNQRAVCTPGWYKLPERERIGNFSLPIHQDPPQVVLASRQSAEAVRAHAKLRDLTQDRRLSLAVLGGVSYGSVLDGLIAAMPRQPMKSTVTALRMSKMLAAGRADYMFIDQEDLDYLDRSGEVSAVGVKAIHFADMPPGLQRYLWCSQKVDKATLDRLNAAIHKLGFDS